MQLQTPNHFSSDANLDIGSNGVAAVSQAFSSIQAPPSVG